MSKTGLVEKARGAVSPVLANLGYDMVEIGIAVSHGRRTLRVFIDKPGGVTVGDCARASKVLGSVLDDQDLIGGRYYLEVSSPGAERKLRTRDDFKRFVGRKASIRLRENLLGVHQFEGRIEDFADDVLRLQPEDGDSVHIPFGLIAGANLCL